MITKDHIHRFSFQNYRKVVLTQISDQTIPAGTVVMTSEGKYECEELSHLAIDSNGNVYPIAESVFQKSFELVK